jgi:hypothetical protein
MSKNIEGPHLKHDHVMPGKRAFLPPRNGNRLFISGRSADSAVRQTGDDPMRKLTTVLAATALVAFAGAAMACPYGAATTADISKPTTTAEAPISKPAQN